MRMRFPGSHWVLTVVILAVVVAVWDFYVAAGYISPLLLPRPGAVAEALWRMLGEPRTYRDIAVTLYEAVAGFLLASIVGIGLGVVLAKLPWLERALQPILVAIQVVPKIVLVPIFILWFGFGTSSKVVIAAVLAFLPILGNTQLGVKSIESGHRDVMSSLGATTAQRLLLLELPSAMPAVLTGMEIGIIFAMIGAVIGEFLAGTAGLGHLAVSQMNAFEVDGLFATVFILSLVSALLYAVVAMLRRWLAGWHATSASLVAG